MKAYWITGFDKYLHLLGNHKNFSNLLLLELLNFNSHHTSVVFDSSHLLFPILVASNLADHNKITVVDIAD